MAVAKLTIRSDNERPQVLVDRPTEGDLHEALMALHGITTALSWIVIQKVADGITTEYQRDDCIAKLIEAGEHISKNMIRRY